MKFEEKITAFQQSNLEFILLEPGRLGEIDITNARFLQNCYFETSVSLSSQIVSRNHRVLIGAYSYMNDGGYLRNASIGRFCSIGRRVSIGAGNHPVSGLSSHPKLVYGGGRAYTTEEIDQLRIRKKGADQTDIGHDVWIGDGAVILAGVKVGTGAVIGANSVVTRDVAPYAISCGIPSREIRCRFPSSVIEKLLASEWWEFPLVTLRQFPVGNVFELIEAFDSKPLMEDDKISSYETYRLP